MGIEAVVKGQFLTAHQSLSLALLICGCEAVAELNPKIHRVGPEFARILTGNPY
jgi:hypothetical protein